MNYIPENPYRNEPDYLAGIVCADEYKFEMLNRKTKNAKGEEVPFVIPTLRCYTNGKRTDVFIEVEYAMEDEEGNRGIDKYTKLPLVDGSLELLSAWFAMQDAKPF